MNIAILGAVLAIGLGVFGAYGLAEKDSAATLNSEAYMTGHLALLAYDENGNVKAYRQTDNIVLNKADNCLADFAFASTLCTAEATFNKIYIGTGGTPGSTTPTEAEADPLPVTISGSAATATIGVQNAASGTGGASVRLDATFANVNANINEAALRDSAAGASSGNSIAYQEFTAIALGASDSLTIQWTLTIDGN